VAAHLRGRSHRSAPRTRRLRIGRGSSDGDWTAAERDERDERARIVAALAERNGNQSPAAKLLGISRATLVNKLSIYASRAGASDV
jgi:DNA-binding NtrC family response regulator